jgi:predicted AlkP superfamily pyrophosphatase or phosphodiesterase
MNKLTGIFCCLLLLGACSRAREPEKTRLLLISIDGLDHRWLRDLESLGVEAPTLKRLRDEGALAAGVVGIVPTVTWPSHTTMITGLPAWEHGIISNDQPEQPGQRWWYVDFLKVKTLWHLVGESSGTAAAVWWPVTAYAGIEFNFPEFWDDSRAKPRQFDPVQRHATPGLTERIQEENPDFGADFSDRQKTWAARFLMENEKPDLFLLHLGELDSAQHETGAFSDEAKATLKHQDELLAELLRSLSPGTVVAIVSDHGFETQRRIFRPAVALREGGRKSKVEVAEGLFGVTDEVAAAFFRTQIRQTGSVIAREVPIEEVREFAPSLEHWSAAFETTFEVLPIAGDDGSAIDDGNGRGYHGLWPTREGYRASFLLWGPGIKKDRLPEISMLDFAPTFAEILGLTLPGARGRSLWKQAHAEE